jgi:hypothetical protein
MPPLAGKRQAGAEKKPPAVDARRAESEDFIIDLDEVSFTISDLRRPCQCPRLPANGKHRPKKIRPPMD